MKKIDTAIILCAGSGARMMPFTNFYPKSFLPIKNKLALEIVVLEAIESGVKNILIVANFGDKFVEMFISWFEKQYQFDVKFRVCWQCGKLGAGGALLECEKFVNSPFFLMFADDITKSKTPVLLRLEKVFYKTQKNVLCVRLVDNSQLKNYGILKISGQRGNIIEFCEIVEKPSVAFKLNFANFGRYVLTPEVFKVLKCIEKEQNGELYLTKALEILAFDKKAVGYKFQGRCFDIGTMKNYIKTFIEF